MRAKAGRRVVGPRTHTPECRARVEKAMAEDDQDRERVQKYQERITEFLEERVEEEDGRNAKRARREGEQAAGGQEQAAGSQGGGEPAEGNQAMGEQAAGGEQKRDRENEEGGTEQENKRNRVDSGGVEQMMTGMAVEYLKGVDVAEIYSPERVCKEAAKFGLKAGWSVDLLNGTDLGKKSEREKVERYQKQEKPLLLVGSPMCTMFSILQAMSGWGWRKQKKWEEDVGHLYWAIDRYEEQLKEGRIFLHEHPASASSRRLGKMQKLMRKPGVYEVVVDQCMFGLRAKTPGGKAEGLARKRTRFITNSWWIAQELNRQCEGRHAHTPLTGGRAKQAQEYPEELCRAICRGLVKEQRSRIMGICQIGEGVRTKRRENETNREKEHMGEEAELEKQAVSKLCQWGGAWDDVSGVELDADMVKQARGEEVTWIREKQVYRKISRAEAAERNLKVIRVRWIDVNKGDKEHPVYRSRLVAMEFRTENKELEDLFAGTPPLEALKLLVSEAATVEKGTADRKCMLLADVSRAFFEADARREICVEILEEDWIEGEGDVVGYLLKSIYGTRDAAANWQQEVAKAMKAWGFKRGKNVPEHILEP